MVRHTGPGKSPQARENRRIIRMSGKNGKEHRHAWSQAGVTLQMGKGGRVVGVQVRWVCGGRRCVAETITQAAIRKPAANARPRSESPAPAREVKAAVERAKRHRREGNTGSLAAMEAYADQEAAWEAAESQAEEFETPGNGNGRRPKTVEEARAGILLYATAADVAGV